MNDEAAVMRLELSELRRRCEVLTAENARLKAELSDAITLTAVTMLLQRPDGGEK